MLNHQNSISAHGLNVALPTSSYALAKCNCEEHKVHLSRKLFKNEGVRVGF